MVTLERQKYPGGPFEFVASFGQTEEFRNYLREWFMREFDALLEFSRERKPGSLILKYEFRDGTKERYRVTGLEA